MKLLISLIYKKIWLLFIEVHCLEWMNVSYLFLQHVNEGEIHVEKNIEIIPLHT